MSRINLSTLRVFGNVIAITGYFIMLHVNPVLGVALKATGLACVIPFCIQLKLWDVVGVMSFFMCIDLSYAAKFIFNY